MIDIPEGYVLVPKEAYDLLIQAADPPRFTFNGDKLSIDPSAGRPRAVSTSS